MDTYRASYNNERWQLVQTVPKLNLGRYEFQKMGLIGSTEIYSIWEWFGPTIISAGLIIIVTASWW